MPPHLHPRSRMTSSLFATTVLASFLVVGLPHVLPCPRPATRRLDGEVTKQQQRQQGQQEEICVVDENGRLRKMRRRTKFPTASSEYDSDPENYRGVRRKEDTGTAVAATMETQTNIVQFQIDKEDVGPAQAQRRECPIPKPEGFLGVLGLRKGEKSSAVEMPRIPKTGEPPSDTR